MGKGSINAWEIPIGVNLAAPVAFVVIVIAAIVLALARYRFSAKARPAQRR